MNRSTRFDTISPSSVQSHPYKFVHNIDFFQRNLQKVLRMKTKTVLLLSMILCATGCANHKQEMTMKTTITPFLMFQDGRAEEAMRFYVGLFPDSEINVTKRYGAGEAGAEGSIMEGHFTVCSQRIMCTDSISKVDFDFTPSTSLFVNCTSKQEHDQLFTAISDGGEVLMPPDNYGFSQWFAYVKDKFGVSWQLNLPSAPTD